jgi:hypothetical protein
MFDCALVVRQRGWGEGDWEANKKYNGALWLKRLLTVFLLELFRTSYKNSILDNFEI